MAAEKFRKARKRLSAIAGLPRNSNDTETNGQVNFSVFFLSKTVNHTHALVHA